MLPDENDGTGEETGDETSQRKSHVLAGSTEVNSPGFSNRWIFSKLQKLLSWTWCLLL